MSLLLHTYSTLGMKLVPCVQLLEEWLPMKLSKSSATMMFP